MDNLNMKTCTRCAEEKLISEYGKSTQTSSGVKAECKKCRASRDKANRDRIRYEDPDKWSETMLDKRNRSRDWRKKNPEKSVQASRKWQLNNPEKKREINRRFAKNNPEAVRNGNRRRRAKERGAERFKVSKKFLRKLYSSPCVICGSSEIIQMDHVFPLNRRGAHSEGNLQPLCKSCNSSKQDSLMIEFRISRGQLDKFKNV